MRTRSMTAAITGQVMSLKDRNGEAGGTPTGLPKITTDGLYGGYRGSLSQGESHGVFPSGLVSEVMAGESSGQVLKAGSSEANPREAAIGNHTDGVIRTPYEVDSAHHVKALASNMSPDDLDDVVKTLLKIRDDRSRNASSALDRTQDFSYENSGVNKQ